MTNEIELLLEITYKCNLNCVHCSSNNYNKEITINDLEKIINLIDNNINIVRISGGQPTLNNDLLDIIKFFREKEIKVILQHNGYTNLPNDILKNINEINLSLYSDKEVHNFITMNNCSYDKIIKFIEKYYKIIPITLCSPIFSLTDCIKVINNAKYYQLNLRFTSLLNHGKCNFAKSISEQIKIYNECKKLYYKIIPHCSLELNVCNCYNKYVINPNLELFKCASNKQNKRMCIK